MKRILAILFLCAVCWNVRAFTFDEISEAVCGIPNNYLRRFFQCVYNESPESIQKYADAMHFCIEYFHNTTEITESLLYVLCEFDPERDGSTSMCYYGATKDMKPDDAANDEQTLLTVLKNCLFSAK